MTYLSDESKNVLGFTRIEWKWPADSPVVISRDGDRCVSLRNVLNNNGIGMKIYNHWDMETYDWNNMIALYVNTEPQQSAPDSN